MPFINSASCPLTIRLTSCEIDLYVLITGVALIEATLASSAATFSSKEATVSASLASTVAVTSSTFAKLAASIASSFSIIFSMIYPFKRLLRCSRSSLCSKALSNSSSWFTTASDSL